MTITWGGILFIVVAGAIVLTLSSERRSTWKILGGGLLGLCVLGFLAAVFAPSAHRATRSQPRNVVPSEVPVLAETASAVPSWPLLAHWPADRYPTRDRAVEALAARVVGELRDGAAACSRLLVVAESDEPGVGDVVNALRLRAGSLSVAMAADDDIDSASDAAVLVVDDQQADEAGALSVDLAYPTLNGDRGDKKLTVAYAAAPWVLEGASVRDPSGAVFVGRSDAVGMSEKAQAIAERVALRRLADAVRARLEAQGMPRVARWALRDDRLDEMLEPIAVATGWRAEAAFAQTLQTGQGSLSRAAVRSAPVNVNRIADQVARQVDARRASWATQGFAVLILGGLTYLGYRVLDGGTRGHFTWRLRVVSLAAFVAATTATLLVVA